MLWAFTFGAIGAIQEQDFFAQHVNATLADYLYFSFVTLTTTGYGDLTARSDLARMLAVTEALIGQLYLVSVVALVIGNIGRERPRARAR
jgi:voltage-gated potassium channel Kch